MTKHSTAEFIAEKLLGCSKFTNEYGEWWNNPFGPPCNFRKIKGFLDSPEGFFAVLKKLNTDIQIVGSKKILQAWNTFLINQNMEAFYNAVIEVMKENN